MEMDTVSKRSRVEVNTALTSAVNETYVIRWDYGNPQLGSCQETIDGGAHFRLWVQNGDEADRCASPC